MAHERTRKLSIFEADPQTYNSAGSGPSSPSESIRLDLLAHLQKVRVLGAAPSPEVRVGKMRRDTVRREGEGTSKGWQVPGSGKGSGWRLATSASGQAVKRGLNNDLRLLLQMTTHPIMRKSSLLLKTGKGDSELHSSRLLLNAGHGEVKSALFCFCPLHPRTLSGCSR